MITAWDLERKDADQLVMLPIREEIRLRASSFVPGFAPEIVAEIGLEHAGVLMMGLGTESATQMRLEHAQAIHLLCSYWEARLALSS